MILGSGIEWECIGNKKRWFWPVEIEWSWNRHRLFFYFTVQNQNISTAKTYSIAQNHLFFISTTQNQLQHKIGMHHHRNQTNVITLVPQWPKIWPYLLLCRIVKFSVWLCLRNCFGSMEFNKNILEMHLGSMSLKPRWFGLCKLNIGWIKILWQNVKFGHNFLKINPQHPIFNFHSPEAPGFYFQCILSQFQQQWTIPNIFLWILF